jgi:ribosomal-protein-alanine N-acetyltransferase
VQTLTTSDLVLEPLTVAHAEAMFELLADPQIYRYLDHPPPPSVDHLRSVYAQLEARQSPDGSERWLNWVVRPHGGSPVGVVQATVGLADRAWVAFVFGSPHWGRGHAHQATQAMIEHLAAAYQVTRCMATVEADNERSVRLLGRLGFRPATPDEAASHHLTATERLYLR